PHLISPPFRAGLHEAFAFAIVACLLAGATSLMRGGRYADAGEESSEPALRPGGGRHSISLQEEQHARWVVWPVGVPPDRWREICLHRSVRRPLGGDGRPADALRLSGDRRRLGRPRVDHP